MTELVFILDRSGSMSGLEKDTIGGFNSMLEKQRKEPGDIWLDSLMQCTMNCRFINQTTIQSFC